MEEELRECAGECRLEWTDQEGAFTFRSVKYEGPAAGEALEAFGRVVNLMASGEPDGEG